MRAITVRPGRKDSAELTEVPEPEPREGELLAEGVALGICGTDAEIVGGGYGEAPEGDERLILGHESLGRVRHGAGDFAEGDLVVGIVRRPDPQPCACCARGEWDFCRTGRYTERGIKGRHGYGSERWTLETDFAVRIDPDLGDLGVLTEPASVLAKAWEQIDRIAGTGCRPRERVLVTGAGPIGQLAALMGVQRDLEVHVLDRATDGPKPQLVRDLGASYHHEGLEEIPPPDVVVECTGAGALVLGTIARNRAGAIVCLTGVSSPGDERTVDVGELNRRIVLENDLVFGSVNANRRHYDAAQRALAQADRGWLERLISRRVALDDFAQALEHRDDDVKVVVDLQSRK